MTEKEIKKLNRADLLQLLLEQSIENDQLTERVAKLEEKLAQRELHIENAGSLAEAVMLVNGVFDSAQAAVDQYLYNLKLINGEADPAAAEPQADASAGQSVASEASVRTEEQTAEKCRLMEEQTAEKCRLMEEHTAEECRRMEEETACRCDKMKADTVRDCRDAVQRAKAELAALEPGSIKNDTEDS